MGGVSEEDDCGSGCLLVPALGDLLCLRRFCGGASGRCCAGMLVSRCLSACVSGDVGISILNGLEVSVVLMSLYVVCPHGMSEVLLDEKSACMMSCVVGEVGGCCVVSVGLLGGIGEEEELDMMMIK